MSRASIEDIYCRDPGLESILRGKRVAFVGPSAHLMGTGSGSLIESYDVVARVNQTGTVPPHLACDYGSRTDVLVACCNKNNLLLLKEQFDKDAHFLRNLKYVVCTQSTVDNDGVRVDLAFQKMNKYNTPFHIIGDAFADYIDEVVGCETNTGFNAIMMFLRYPIRELYVTGISFYNMGRLGRCYNDESYETLKKVGLVTDNPGNNVYTIGHNQIPQMHYFVKLLERYPNLLTIDSYLKENLPMSRGSDLHEKTVATTTGEEGGAKKAWKLEIAITDYCNLSCQLCSQGTPLQKDKKTMSMADLERISAEVRPYEFEVIKISGGEPTLHPQFVEICQRLPKLFKTHRFELATNGFRLEEYKGCLHVFDKVDLGYYPGRNDDVIRRFGELQIPNVSVITKRDAIEMVDVYEENNLNKAEIYEHCPYAGYRKIVQGRIYPCCVIFGQAMRQGIDTNEISAAFDAEWRENLAGINIEEHCRRCFVDIEAPAAGVRSASPAAVSSSGRGRITMFALPKAFIGHADVIQRNALKSWMILDPTPEIILLGDDPGVHEAAREFGLRHVPGIRRNSCGTPLVSDIFRQAEAHASNDIMTYINSDIILLSDFMPAVRAVAGRFDRFLMTGRRWDTDVREVLDFSAGDCQEKLRQFVCGNAFLHQPTGMDYFVYTRGLWPAIPDFAIGRMAWDSWLVGKQIDDANVVVDATETVMAIHQDHEVAPTADRRAEESLNRQLAGTAVALGSTSCAAWKLTRYGIIPRHAGDFLKNANVSVAFTCLDRAFRQNSELMREQYEHFMRCTHACRIDKLVADARMQLQMEPDNAAARFTLRRTGQKDSESAIELFNKGLDLLRASNAGEAVRCLNQVLTYSVELPNLHYALGVAFTQLGDLSSAQKSCERELALYPQNEAARKLLDRIAGSGAGSVASSRGDGVL